MEAVCECVCVLDDDGNINGEGGGPLTSWFYGQI